jgi:hypothetical protein
MLGMNERLEWIRSYYSQDLVIDDPPAGWDERVLAALGDGDPSSSDEVIPILQAQGIYRESP